MIFNCFIFKYLPSQLYATYLYFNSRYFNFYLHNFLTFEKPSEKRITINGSRITNE